MNVTMKNIKKEYSNLISIGYCDAQYLLKFNDPSFTTSGVYGWNADIYPINNTTAIVTGYRPFGNISPDWRLLKKYEEKAEDIIKNENDYNTQKRKVQKLLDKFINQLLAH